MDRIYGEGWSGWDRSGGSGHNSRPDPFPLSHGVSNSLAFVLIYLGRYPGLFG
jgi:hypothetical protein